MKNLIIIFIILITLSGCNFKKVVDTKNVSSSNATNEQIDLYNVYTEIENYKPSKYEPKTNCYLGAYLSYKNSTSNTIKDFENLTNTNHLIYGNALTLGDAFPLTWVLSCYSNGKVPLITILPKNTNNPFDYSLLEQTAKNFGTLKIPIFVNFYQDPKNITKNEDSYIAFFKAAKAYFSIYAPNIALIWSVDSNNVIECIKYYPGDNYVDWVGINIFENLNSNGEINKTLTELDYFYNIYEEKKPIAITSLAISHFSNKTLNYEINKKIEELKRFYETIPQKYPRIKMINYFNYNGFNKKKQTQFKENFLITDNQTILEEYSKLTNTKIFTKDIVINTEFSASKELKKEPFVVYEKDNEFFISEKNLSFFNNDKNFKTNLNNNIKFNNEIFYPLNDIIKLSNLISIIDYTNKKIMLNSK